MRSMTATARRRRVLILIVLLLAAYVGSYFVMSRRGMRANVAIGAEGFGFFPPAVERLSGGASEGLLVCDHVLLVIYWPVWAVDYYLLGGPYHSPMHGPM